MLRRRPGRLLSVLCTFNVRPMSREKVADNVEAETEDVRCSISDTKILIRMLTHMLIR